MVRKRFDEIDVMRIIGFLMVLDQHILGAYAKRPDTGFADSMVLHFLYLIGRPAVPMFIAITGFTLFYTYYNRFNIGDYYKKRLTGIVMPYLFWSFATIVIFRKYFLIKDIILVLATGSASYHLWYMAMSIRLYLWFPLILALISWILKKNSVFQKSAFILFFALYWLLLRNNTHLTDAAANLIFGAPSALDKKLVQYSPIYWSMYFVCGVMVSHRYEYFKDLILRHSKKIVVTYIPLTAYMFYTQISYKLPEYLPHMSYAHLPYILFMLQTIAVAYIASVKIINNAGSLRERILELGSLSYGAYLIHVVILQELAPIVRRAVPVHSNLVYGLIIYISAAILAFALCYLIRLLPFSKYIIGVRRMPVRPARAHTNSIQTGESDKA